MPTEQDNKAVELAKEIFAAISRKGQGQSIASVLGVLELVKADILHEVGEYRQKKEEE